MKRFYIFFLVFLGFMQSKQAQTSISDFNFESTTNPAFTLVDETPTAINSPENIKSLAVYAYNGFSNGNIALESNPYWIIPNKKDRSYYDYRGIKLNNKGAYYINPFNGIKTNSSFSFGYITKQFDGYAEEKKVASVGVRTALFQFYNQNKTKGLVDILERTRAPYSNEALQKFNGTLVFLNLIVTKFDAEEYIINNKIPQNFIDAANNFLANNSEFNSSYPDGKSLANAYFKEIADRIVNFYYNPKDIKPFLRIDAALAYGMLFKDNNIASNVNRFSSWLTLDFAINLIKKENLRSKNANYLHVYCIAKYVDDGFIANQGVFWDYGGKVELEFHKLKFAYEYLKRDGFGKQYRSVGNINYQVFKKVSLTGAFGKDFPEDNNLITLLGVNWDLDFKGLF
ncbi:hypothetical protein PW52_04110 [Tamlana sedimentorum]|uniref:Alginate export domain-containing protein n=1 Tax=Neotamlana sedimentorum TaxID=1435349 RepID=A0A0D7WCN1_9FLAO|nr:hypothetical protein [Tamlana sedimentorum]KJD36824.1 hypothetical protein PW52_04110 [Tamlana sedimentorum]